MSITFAYCIIFFLIKVITEGVKDQDSSLIIWWLHVTVKPDKSKINVFNKGIFKGFKTLIPNGGQTEPSSTLGDKLAWKKAQKKEKKKHNFGYNKQNNAHTKPLLNFFCMITS